MHSVLAKAAILWILTLKMRGISHYYRPPDFLASPSFAAALGKARLTYLSVVRHYLAR